MSNSSEIQHFRRCYVSGDNAAAIAQLVVMIRARGIETASAADVGIGEIGTKEVIRLIDSTDFVVFVITNPSRSGAAWELGLAQGRDKPAFVIFTSRPNLDLDSAYTVAVDEGAHLESIAPDLDRFIRHAKRPAREDRFKGSGTVAQLDWAREELRALRALESLDRYKQFESFCAKIFRSMGAEVANVGDDRAIGADLVVWFDNIAFELGGPTLVECKFYGGGVGSVIKNSEATVRKIQAVMERSEATLALIVYDHDHRTPLPNLFETPRVLSLAVEDVIQAIEYSELEKMILKRRDHVLFARRPQ